MVSHRRPMGRFWNQWSEGEKGIQLSLRALHRSKFTLFRRALGTRHAGWGVKSNGGLFGGRQACLTSWRFRNLGSLAPGLETSARHGESVGVGVHDRRIGEDRRKVRAEDIFFSSKWCMQLCDSCRKWPSTGVQRNA